MRSIKDYFTFTSDYPDGQIVTPVTNSKPANDSGYVVSTYAQFLSIIAQLSYRNNQYQLFFRGQNKDYKTTTTGAEGVSSKIYPSIFRNDTRYSTSALNAAQVVKRKFELLDTVDREFLRLANEDLFNEFGDEIKKSKLLRISLLQHYEICDTPLLDVSSSPEIALSFSFESNSEPAYLYILALPQIVGTVTSSVESQLQVVRLPQFCPPDYLRPHYQHGHLVGEFPEIIGYTKTLGTGHKGAFNFKHRLLAKVVIPSISVFEDSGFNRVAVNILRPEEPALTGAIERLKLIATPLISKLNSEINEKKGY